MKPTHHSVAGFWALPTGHPGREEDALTYVKDKIANGIS